jgi:hypothetical protein
MTVHSLLPLGLISKPRKPMNQVLTIDEKLNKHLCKQIASFKGDGNVLETALGAVVLGQHLGTRALQMSHSPATLKKCEKLLDIEFKKVCPERTQLTTKIRGVRIADSIGAFWKVVMGKEPVKQKHYAED